MKKIIERLRKQGVLKVLIAGTILAVLAGVFIVYQLLRDRIAIDDSIVVSPIISISPSSPGKIFSINVHDGEKVNEGQIMAIVGTNSLISYKNGIVVSTDNEIGSIATAQTPVVQMINLSDMRIAGTIDENKGLDKIKIGQAVSFTVDALHGKTFWGYVDEISPTAKQTQLQFSVSSERPTQQFIVYANFNAYKYPQILNGMSAKMTVYTKTP